MGIPFKIFRITLVFLVGSFFFTMGLSARTAVEAWEELVGPRFIKFQGFAPVENDPRLPNVLIYGDSISIYYTPAVRKVLEGKANVYRIHCNGGDSASFIPNMTVLHTTMGNLELEGHWDFSWDVIHFNVGLHDLKYMKDGKLDSTGKQVASTETYAANLRSIIRYLKEFAPRATLIFATTTPVPENSGGRMAGDAARYNVAAREVLREYPEILVSDLYTLTKPHQKDWWAAPGNVHFTKEGSEAQGAFVAQLVAESLSNRK